MTYVRLGLFLIQSHDTYTNIRVHYAYIHVYHTHPHTYTHKHTHVRKHLLKQLTLSLSAAVPRLNFGGMVDLWCVLYRMYLRLRMLSLSLSLSHAHRNAMLARVIHRTLSSAASKLPVLTFFTKKNVRFFGRFVIGTQVFLLRSHARSVTTQKKF